MRCIAVNLTTMMGSEIGEQALTEQRVAELIATGGGFEQFECQRLVE